MHYISYVKREDPVISSIIFDTKGASSSNLKLLLYLKFVHLFKRLERDLQFLLFSHAILEIVSSLFKVPLTYLTELFLDSYQLLDNIMSLEDLLLENLYLLRNVLTAASV